MGRCLPVIGIVFRGKGGCEEKSWERDGLDWERVARLVKKATHSLQSHSMR